MCHSKNVGLKKLNQIGYRQLRKIICYFKLKSVLRSQNFYCKIKQCGKPDMPVIKTYRQRSITQQIGRWNEKLRKNIQVFNKNWILDCSKCNNVVFSHFDQSLNSCSNKKFNKRSLLLTTIILVIDVINYKFTPKYLTINCRSYCCYYLSHIYSTLIVGWAKINVTIGT